MRKILNCHNWLKETALEAMLRKLSPIKNLNCIMNEVNKLTTHFQNVDKDAFFNKYGRLMEIARVEVLSPAVRAIVHFWDPDYRCFSFGSIDLWLESLWRKGINKFCISFLFINVINLSSSNEKGVDPSSYAKSISWWIWFKQTTWNVVLLAMWQKNLCL